MGDGVESLAVQRRESLLTATLLVGSIYLFGRLAHRLTDRYRAGDPDGDHGKDGVVMSEVRRVALPAAAGPALELLGKATSTRTLGPASMVVAAALLPRHSWAALFLLANAAGTLATQKLMKVGLGRPRPEEHRRDGNSPSFPSGHSSLTTALALTACLIARREFTRYERRVTASALFFAVLIGVSRPLLRQHYPSDVLAGHALGVACVLANHLWYMGVRSR